MERKVLDRTIRYAYLIILILGIIYAISAYVIEPCVTKFFDQGGIATEIKPDKVEQLNELTKKYTFYFYNEEDISRCIQFNSSHEEVYLFADDELFFERYANNEYFGISPGTAINICNIPTGTRKIEIVFKEAYVTGEDTSHSFLYGNGEYLFDQVVSRSVPGLIISILIFFIGGILLIFWLITHRRFVVNDSVLHLAIFTMLIGIWSVNETEFTILLISNRVFASILGYVILNLMIYPYIQFIRCYLDMKKEFLFYIISTLSIVNALAVCILHITGIVDFRVSSVSMHLLVGLAFVYIVWASIYQSRRGLMITKINVHFSASLFLLVAALVNVYQFFHGGTQTSLLGKIGILIYIMTLGLYNFIESYDQIDEVKRANMYRNMAFTDLMTGLYNRSAFEKWEEETKDYFGVSIVTFDLNSLKSCNDYLGHAKGDLYINTVAECIHTTFGNYGKCYRIGGDEFCVIMRNHSLDKIEKLIHQFIDSVEAANQKYSEIEMSVAVGMAIYHRNDRDFENTRSRADSQMYHNKRKYKKGEN